MPGSDVPDELFASLMRAGRQARQRGQHRHVVSGSGYKSLRLSEQVPTTSNAPSLCKKQDWVSVSVDHARPQKREKVSKALLDDLALRQDKRVRVSKCLIDDLAFRQDKRQRISNILIDDRAFRQDKREKVSKALVDDLALQIEKTNQMLGCIRTRNSSDGVLKRNASDSILNHDVRQETIDRLLKSPAHSITSQISKVNKNLDRLAARERALHVASRWSASLDDFCYQRPTCQPRVTDSLPRPRFDKTQPDSIELVFHTKQPIGRLSKS